VRDRAPFELERAREARGRRPARLRAGANPVLEVGLGEAARTLAGAAGEPLLQAEALRVGEAAVLVFPQDDAAAAHHLRHLREPEDESFGVLAEDREPTARSSRRDARLGDKEKRTEVKSAICEAIVVTSARVRSRCFPRHKEPFRAYRR